MLSSKHTYIDKSITIAKGKDSCLSAGAVMVYKDKEIYATTSKTLEEDDPTAHAAVVAIRKTRAQQHVFLLNDYELYLSEKPCPMCLTAIEQAHIKKIYYLEYNKIKYMELSRNVLLNAFSLREFNAKKT
ncbi:MAG: nucleoside deaminase [Bacteroidales bacterium]|jgi:tRNA(Arg) A34 adenosine deaminase TadA|nr:nucleoside deaminase [Bacteroidales bacterium]MDD3330382.1 nucleoside deaminase [Bacteroidales bacterium]MDD4044405.1 nucleoside deaminase [Bacteroidales bacterium]MDD4581232.1 nucleoside deaminase [Bacteroidales bacterium]NLO41842.1 nucleoside deaminase [Bacteroidales bacterium]